MPISAKLTLHSHFVFLSFDAPIKPLKYYHQRRCVLCKNNSIIMYTPTHTLPKTFFLSQNLLLSFGIISLTSTLPLPPRIFPSLPRTFPSSLGPLQPCPRSMCEEICWMIRKKIYCLFMYVTRRVESWRVPHSLAAWFVTVVGLASMSS